MAASSGDSKSGSNIGGFGSPSASFAQNPSVAECGRLREMLSRKLPEIPPIYFYDDRGSALFEQITKLEAYYPTRTEVAILEGAAREIVQIAAPQEITELGSGAGKKIRLLIDAWLGAGGLALRQVARCTMLDVNREVLSSSIARLSAAYPDLTFRAIQGDFTTDLPLLRSGGPRLIVFFAGTIGNLYPEEQRRFFDEIARGMSPRDTLLVGVDLVKEKAILERAYNDPEGMTAQFNKNALSVLNARFGATFAEDGFDHRAFYDEQNAWIEMRLVARRPMRVTIAALELTLDLKEGAEIRTEVSCKLTEEMLTERAPGLRIERFYTDPRRWFGLALMQKRGAAEVLGG